MAQMLLDWQWTARDDFDDHVYIKDGQLFNLPFIPRGFNDCTCECDGEYEGCEFTVESRCLPCIGHCPGVKVFGPPPSMVEDCLARTSDQLQALRSAKGYDDVAIFA